MPLICLLAISAPLLPALKESKISSVAVLPLAAKGKVPRDVVEVLDDLLLSAMHAQFGQALRIVGKSDIDALIGFERKKDILGCNSASCVAEIAGALGVDSVMTGAVGALGSKHILTLTWIAQRDAHAISRSSETLPAAVESFDEGMVHAVAVLAGTQTTAQAGGSTALPDFKHYAGGRCEIVLPPTENCPAHPEYKGTLNDTYSYSADIPWVCRMRATEWFYWCNNKVPVTSRYFVGDKLQEVFASSKCEISLPTKEGCPKHPENSGVQRDSYYGSNFYQPVCRERAAEWYFWCGNKQAVDWSFSDGNSVVAHDSFSP